MDAVALVSALSGGAASAVVVGGTFRRYWHGREARNQAAFRAAVQAVVDASVADVIARQAQFEQRQGRHLDRQDAAIAALRKEVTRDR